jgi:hypothetical protein
MGEVGFEVCEGKGSCEEVAGLEGGKSILIGSIYSG